MRPLVKKLLTSALVVALAAVLPVALASCNSHSDNSETTADVTEAHTAAATNAPETLPETEAVTDAVTEPTTSPETEAVTVPDETQPPEDELSLQDKYGAQIDALDQYAHYGFAEVEEIPLLNLSFDTEEDLNQIPNSGSIGGAAWISDADGARRTAGRFDLRGALEFTAPGTYVAAPDLGEQDQLTISMWVNLKDISNRASDSDTRITTLLDTRAGTGRVTLSLVHTGSTLNTTEEQALVSSPKTTKLVFSVEGNAGGTFADCGLYANNTHYSNFEYTIPGEYNTWIAHAEGHCWFHIGIVYDPSVGEVTFYHEGKLDSTQKFTTAVKPVLNGLRLGSGYAENTYLDGKIDDVRIYGTALPAEDIETLADFERDMWVYRTMADWEESQTVLYVDGARGDDSNPGTKDAPFATVKKGVESITAPGTRLIIAPGIYREAGINLRVSGTEYAPVIIEAEVPGKTVISGSTVMDNWQETQIPFVYSHAWSYEFVRQSNVPGNDFLARTDMLWVDGEPMRPVYSTEELIANSYYLDEQNNTVYLMVERELHDFTAEVPNLGIDPVAQTGAYLLHTHSSDYLVLRGLTFTNAGTRLWDNSMVHLGIPHHVLVEDCQFNNTNTAGLGWDSGWVGKTAEDICIRRCQFDNNGASGIGAGFRTMSLVVEQSEFTDIGWKIDWGEYNSPDPATVKMMVCKNIIYRANRFDQNFSNDLWFDNFNWNVTVVDNVFTRNHADVGVHIEIDTPGVLIRNNVIEGGVRWANTEGMILDSNIFYGEKELICTWDSGTEFRFGDIGPIYGWKDTVMTDNLFYFTGLRNYPIIALPQYACAADMHAEGNKLYAPLLSHKNKGFKVGETKMDISSFAAVIGDTTFDFLPDDSFTDDGNASVAFTDAASRARTEGLTNYIPVALSRILDKQVSVGYTVWDYETGEKLDSGLLIFEAFDTEQEIYVGDGSRSILIELSDANGILVGEQSFHYQAKAE